MTLPFSNLTLLKEKMEQTFYIKEDYQCLNHLITLKKSKVSMKGHKEFETYITYLENRADFLYKYYFDTNYVLYKNIKYDQLQIGKQIMDQYLCADAFENINAQD